jgi:hypothetical protein
MAASVNEPGPEPRNPSGDEVAGRTGEPADAAAEHGGEHGEAENEIGYRNVDEEASHAEAEHEGSDDAGAVP